jgi:MFS family permease
MAVAVLCAVQVVDVLGVTVLVSTLPTMLASLGATPSMAGVVATSYAMSFGGLLMLGARLGDRLGHRNVLLVGLLLFAGASALAATAPSLAVVVVARCVQGAAAAASVPAALRLLSEVTIGELARRRALGAWSAAGAAAGASGLLLGGLLTSLTGWRAVFWLNVPVAALLIVGVLRVIPKGTPTSRAALDLGGAVLLTTALMGLILGAACIQERHTRSLGAALAGCGVLLLALFAVTQRVACEPLLPPEAMREPRLRIGMGTSFLNTATTSSLVVLATLYLQDTRHATPSAAALSLLPFSLCVVLGSGISVRTLQRRDPALGIAAGLGLIAAGDAATLLLPSAETLLPICVGVAGLGIGFSSVGSTTIGTDVPTDLQGTAAGVLNTAAQLGTALGVSAALLLASLTEDGNLPLRGPSLSWAIAALLASCGALLALRRLLTRRPATQHRQRDIAHLAHVQKDSHHMATTDRHP